jgi:hypothetical protein
VRPADSQHRRCPRREREEFSTQHTGLTAQGGGGRLASWRTLRANPGTAFGTDPGDVAAQGVAAVDAAPFAPPPLAPQGAVLSVQVDAASQQERQGKKESPLGWRRRSTRRRRSNEQQVPYEHECADKEQAPRRRER